jgi:benzodiazapine receptor
MNRNNVIKLIVSILVCQVAGGIGALFTTSSIPTWYATLNKPSFTPPSWIFGPVWTVLYLMMGIAAFLVWRKGLNDPQVKTALIIFVVQLALNALWSFLFFGLRSPLAGLVDIVLLWVFIMLTIVLFIRISTIAGLLLIPYLLWVSFATVLNFAIWRLNV